MSLPTFARGFAALTGACWLAFCGGAFASGPGADQASGYKSVWAKMFPNSLPATPAQAERLSPIYRNFYAAASSKKLKEATKRWKQFQTQHPAVDGEFEDAVHSHLWTWARSELERCRLIEAGNAAGTAKVEQALRNLAAQIEG